MAGELRWLFTKEELTNTPSRKAGIDAEKELNYRQQCANLIQDMGQKLQVTQLCINTAIVYMHRFYMFHSFTKFHRNPMGAACLFLAAKVEEQPRKLEHVIRAYHFCVNRDQGSLDVKSEAYLELAQECVVNENILLQTLGFSISVEHPHAMVVKTCTLVKASKDLAQTSYFLATNSLHLTTMCLKYSHTVVACVCIHLACKWSNYQIPRSTEGKEWYEYVDKKITKEMLENLTQEFLQILDNCPSKLKKKILTWKSGSKSLDDQNHPGGERINHLEVTHSPLHQARHPSTSTAADQDPSAMQSGAAVLSALRRVRTEPALAHKDYLERKQREQQQQQRRHPHKPGYHAGQPSAAAGGPTHPPPGATSRPTHPPPSRRPPPGGAPHPHHPAAAHRTDDKSHAPHHEPRSNIFETLQHERQRAHDGGSTQAARDGAALRPHPESQATDQAAGNQWSGRSQARQGDSAATSVAQGQVRSSQGHAAPSASATSTNQLSVQDKMSQALGRSALVKTEKDKPEQKPALIEKPGSTHPQAKMFSKANQDNLEKMMMEKLQSEILKQKHKDSASAHKRQSPEKAGPLRSPPPIKRQKSSSGSDSTTPKKEDRDRKIQEMKEKLQQEDQKRLRRLSEELGDDRLREKPIVVLDNVFTSPQSITSSDNALLSPGALTSNVEAVIMPHKEGLTAAPKDSIDGRPSSSQAHPTASVHSAHAHLHVQTHAHKSHVRKDGKPVEPAAVKPQHPHAQGVKKEGPHAHQHSAAEAAKHAAHRHHRKEHSDPAPHKRSSDTLKHAALSKEIKKEPVDVPRGHPRDYKSEPVIKEVKREPSDAYRGYTKNIKPDPDSDVKTDVSEILKTIGRKEDFLRIGPPREIKNERMEAAGTSSDTVTSQASAAVAAAQVEGGKDAAGMVRNKSTISLEKYRERRPLTPSHNVQDKASPLPATDPASLHAKDQLAKDILGDTMKNSLKTSVKVEGCKDGGVINVKKESSRNVIKETVRNSVRDVTRESKKESSNGVSKEPGRAEVVNKLHSKPPHVAELSTVLTRSPQLTAEFPISSPSKAADAKTLMRSKKDKLDKLTARIERPPERSHTGPDARGDKPVEKAAQRDHAGHGAAVTQSVPPASMPVLSAHKPPPAVTVHPSSPSVEPGEIIDDGPVDSPVRKEKVGLKIKLGGESMVVTSMSPHTDPVTSQTSSQPAPRDHHHHQHQHHHKEKHKHKHKHKHKNKEREKERRHHHKEGGEARHRSPASSAAALGDSGSSSDLKMKFTLKHLGRGGGGADSPPAAARDPAPAATADSAAGVAPMPMKLVLSKDKSGQYSSGHKHKHSSSSSRKRTHSPVESDRLAGSAAKMPRSDLPGTPSNGGSKPGSPHERLEMTRKSSESLERILHNQKRMLGKLKDKQSGSKSSKSKSPARLPAGYQNPNPDV